MGSSPRLRSLGGAVIAFATIPLGARAAEQVSLLAQPAAVAPFATDRIALLDADEDGRLDIAAASDSNVQVAIALAGVGLEYTSVSSAGTLPIQPVALLAADLDGDGHSDLAAAGKVASLVGRIAWLRGLGDGTFSVGAPDVTTSFHLTTLDAADVDGDGDVDLFAGAASNPPHGAQLYLNSGSGAFSSGASFTLGTNAYPIDVDVGDLDLDGDPDFALAAEAPTQPIVLVRNDGGSVLATLATFPSAAAASVRLVDLNGDGYLDVARGRSDGLAFRLQSGGAFLPEQPVPETANLWSFEAGDLDGDGDADLALVTSAAGSRLARVGWNLGTADFQPSVHPYTTLPVSGSGSVAVGAVADVDSDGHADVVTRNGQLIGVTRGLGGEQFDAAIVSAQNLTHLVSDFHSALADVDGDAALDFVTSVDKAVHAALGLGNGEFGPPIASVASQVPIVSSLRSEPCDLDADGAVDLVAAYTEHPVTVAYGLRALRGAGNGTFTVAADLTASGAVYEVEIADVNADGFLDVVYNVPGSVHTRRGDGAFGFLPPSAIPFSGVVTDVEAGDVNADGRVDLTAVTEGAFGATHVLLGTGGGAFTSAITQPVPNAETLELGDVDHDGLLDLAVSKSGGDPFLRVVLFRMKPSGTYSQAGTIAKTDSSTFTSDLAFADVTADGEADLVLSTVGLRVYPGNGEFTFDAPRTFQCMGTYGNVAGDLNGDGVVDLAVRNGTATSYPVPLSIYASLSRPAGPWIVRDYGTPGSDGKPRLIGLGSLAPATVTTLRLADARPNSSAWLAMGLAAANVPLLGGTLFPIPQIFVGPLPTDGAGELNVTGVLPAGIPGATSLKFQAIVADPEAFGGYALSNGLEGITP